MSIIGVRVPKKMDLLDLVRVASKHIPGQFEPLNFRQHSKKAVTKLGYLRLSATLDPAFVVEKLNSSKDMRDHKIIASLLDEVPDIPLSAFTRLPVELRKQYNFLGEMSADEAITTLFVKKVSREILVEMQYKYPGLYPFNKKYLYQPIEELTKIVRERLVKVIESKKTACVSYFKVSQLYRASHPHTGDFQLLVGILHKIQVAAGDPETEFSEKHLSTVPTRPLMAGNMPEEKTQQVVTKYSDRINKVMRAHIKELNTEPSADDTEEISARKRVREELQKMSPFIGQFVNEVVLRNFVPHRLPNQQMRVYGEPFIPNRDVLGPLLLRYNARRIDRSTFIYNLVKFSVARDKYAAIMAMNGTVVNGAKLIFRPSSLTSCLLDDDNKPVEAGDELMDEDDEEEEQMEE